MVDFGVEKIEQRPAKAKERIQTVESIIYTALRRRAGRRKACWTAATGHLEGKPIDVQGGRTMRLPRLEGKRKERKPGASAERRIHANPNAEVFAGKVEGLCTYLRGESGASPD